MFGYGAFRQLKEMIPVFIATGIMAIFVLITNSILDNLWLKFGVGASVGITSYLLICYLFKLNELHEVKTLLWSMVSKVKN
jgi:hypothetical protein